MHNDIHVADFLSRLQSEMASLEPQASFHEGSKQAAVAAVLHLRAGVLRVPFVLRRRDLAHHPGQVALPGGTIQAGETAWEGAAREVEEELGVPRADLQPLGRGEVVHASVSDFSVLPVVAWLAAPPARFEPDARELEAVFDVPLPSLLEETAWTEMPDPRLDRCFSWEGM